MRFRYVICPGAVVSKNDGQIHEVGAFELVRLYGLTRQDSYSVASEHYPVEQYNDANCFLMPRYEGDYAEWRRREEERVKKLWVQIGFRVDEDKVREANAEIDRIALLLEQSAANKDIRRTRARQKPGF